MSAEDTAAQAVQEDKAVYTIAEWCLEAKASPALFFKENRNGRGPYLGHMGRRTVVLESPPAFYRRRVSV